MDKLASGARLTLLFFAVRMKREWLVNSLRGLAECSLPQTVEDQYAVWVNGA